MLGADIPQIIGWFVSIGLTGIGILVLLIRVLLSQFEKRLDQRFNQVEKATEEIAKLDYKLMQLKSELPERYVMRDDYVRGQTVLEAKMDALYYRMTGGPAADWNSRAGEQQEKTNERN
ncbi:hypothetical protein R84981_001720 [Carnimonas sp. R-84981]|uniref:hypothetical protein n=1 Tax=Carnimonas bestiolae TaxID=3402172 RepID=UPI003EDC4A3B